MRKPLVSILIPAYNAERWISEALGAAVAQTWPNKEVIVMDDGSDDQTFNVAMGFSSRAVKVVRQDNRGACAARNEALSHAQGDFIQWLDADDLLAPDKIALQMEEEARDPGQGTLYTSTWGRFYFTPARATLNEDSLWADHSPADWLVTKFTTGAWMNPAGWLVSRAITEAAGRWNEALSLSGDDDGEYLCRLVAASQRVRFVAQAKSFYRIGNPSGLSWRRSDQAMQSLYLATSLSIGHLRRLEDSLRTRRACIHYLQSRLKYFEPLHPAISQQARARWRRL